MTIRLALATIRGLGLTANYRPLGSFSGEFRIDYHHNNPLFVGGDEGSAYFTNDAQDAIDTAKYMSLNREDKA